MDLSNIAVVVLAAISAGGIAYVFLYPILSGENRAEKRQKALTTPLKEQRSDRAAQALNRRDQVAQSLKDIEARERARNKVTLDDRIAQAGLDWSRSKFFMVSGVIGVVVALVILILSKNLLAAIVGGFAGTLGLPRWILTFLKNRRIASFIDELPNAMDIIVRGIKAGLPLGDCMREIAVSTREPLRTEFRLVVESQAVGIPLPDGLQRLYARVPVAEANFLATVIGIQSKSGGNLSEAIGNLSRVLRDRKKMRGKIKAMSMEAKASAAIIAALPFVVAFLTYMSSPSYIELLWTTQMGRMVMAGAGLWMLLGVLVMKKMISFDV